MAIIEKSVGMNKYVADMESGFKDRNEKKRYYYGVEFDNGKRRILRSENEYPIGTRVGASMKWGYAEGTVCVRDDKKPEELHKHQIPKILHAELPEEEDELIRALIVRPGMVPEEITVSTDEDSMKRLLGNTGIANINNRIKIINGDKDGDKLNRAVYSDGWQLGAIVSGTFLVVGDDAGKTVSLSDEDMAKYAEIFRVPDVFSNAAFNAKVAEFYGPQPEMEDDDFEDEDECEDEGESEDEDDSDMFRIENVCPMCNGKHYIMLTRQEYVDYKIRGLLLQNALPDRNPLEREFVKSGYCPKCQKMLFGTSYKSDSVKPC